MAWDWNLQNLDLAKFKVRRAKYEERNTVHFSYFALRSSYFEFEYETATGEGDFVATSFG
jgi:hypothetical protein